MDHPEVDAAFLNGLMPEHFSSFVGMRVVEGLRTLAAASQAGRAKLFLAGLRPRAVYFLDFGGVT